MKFTSLKELKDAKAHRKDWREIADAVIKTLKSMEVKDRFGQMKALYKEAEQQSGYSASMLRRMVTVRRFTTEAEKELPGISKTKGPPIAFPILEIFQRFYKSNPDEALKIWRDVQVGMINLSEMKKVYRERATPLQEFKIPKSTDSDKTSTTTQFAGHGRAALSVFKRDAAKSVASNLEKLCDDARMEFYVDHYQLDYAHADGVAIYMPGPNVEWADGFDFRLKVQQPTTRSTKQMYAEIEQSASFFRRYWVITPKGAKGIERLETAIMDLGLSWVGIATVDLKDPEKLEVVVDAMERESKDRQVSGLTSITRTGVPKTRQRIEN